MATNPLYSYGTVVYFKESAALGFIEAIRISGVHQGINGWMYSINTAMGPGSPGGFQDRRSLVNTQVLYYSEDEFVTLRDAYLLAEANAKLTYDKLKAQRQSLFPDEPTGTD